MSMIKLKKYYPLALLGLAILGIIIGQSFLVTGFVVWIFWELYQFSQYYEECQRQLYKLAMEDDKEKEGN